MDDRVRDIAAGILSGVREALGGGWGQLTPADVELIRACAADAALLTVQALAMPQTADAQQALLREKAHVAAQLANVKALNVALVSNAFWGAVQKAVNGLVAIAFAAI